jgi:hypothetical protein
MAERKPNVTKVIAWFMAVKGVIKFTDDEATYKLSDAVIKASNFEKFPLSKNDTVEVSISDGTVTYLRKQKSNTPKDEGKGSEEAYEPTAEDLAPKTEQSSTPKTESSKTDVSDTKELTVFAVSANKKVVKFTELKDAGWFTISEEIQKMDYSIIGLIAKNRVKVQFVDKNIIQIAKLSSEPAESSQDKAREANSVAPTASATTATQTPVQAPKKEWKPYNSQDNDARQLSIECQACINSACQVVGMMAANIEPKPTANILNAMIESIARSNYKLLQDLKKS